MNLYNVDFTYDVDKRTKPTSFSLGGLLNPFS
jgi:hypothetical protein